MKKLYRIFRRGRRYYSEHVETRRQTSLGTSDKTEALRLIAAKNEAAQMPILNIALARTYMSAHDQRMIDRTWISVMDEIVRHGAESTRARYFRAVKSQAFDGLRLRRVVETTSDDFISILRTAKPSTNHFLRRLHNLALGLGWLPWAILPPRLWPDIRLKKKRSITAGEHSSVLEAEQNPERRSFYEMLWETGAAQTDVAMLTAANIDWSTRVLSYQRCKTGEWAHLIVGDTLEQLLDRLPKEGPLFPTICTSNASARAAEFCRRIRLAGIKGVSLHSYRYAWAERAKSAGYPERWAQSALGHNSRAVHAAYSKGAVVLCPPFESYERKLTTISAAPGYGPKIGHLASMEIAPSA